MTRKDEAGNDSKLYRFICSECHLLLEANAKKTGTQTQCPSCMAEILVPINLVEDHFIYEKDHREAVEIIDDDPLDYQSEGDDCEGENKKETVTDSEKHLSWKIHIWNILNSTKYGYVGVAIFFICAIILLSIFGESDHRVTVEQRFSGSEEWYEGGTLHRATIGEWRSASSRNKLATCADYVMKIGKFNSIPADLKSRAIALQTCIEKGISSVTDDNKQVSEFAAVCAILLGY